MFVWKHNSYRFGALLNITKIIDIDTTQHTNPKEYIEIISNIQVRLFVTRLPAQYTG